MFRHPLSMSKIFIHIFYLRHKERRGGEEEEEEAEALQFERRKSWKRDINIEKRQWKSLVVSVLINNQGFPFFDAPVNSFLHLSPSFLDRLSYDETWKERYINVQMNVAQLVRIPNGDLVIMGPTPTFHNGI